MGKAHVLCECEDLATIRHNYLGHPFLDTEGDRSLRLGQSGTLFKEQGSHDLTSV
jgi:hypothetical protein